VKIVVTAREILDSGNWEEFCDMVGLDYYCIAEGMDEDREFELTNEEAIKLNVLKRDKY
jgi:hypothetical protein